MFCLGTTSRPELGEKTSAQLVHKKKNNMPYTTL